MSAPRTPSYRANNEFALPRSPDGFYLRDPSGVVFDVIQRDATG